LAAIATALALLGPAAADQLLREGFEGTDPLWVKGPADGVSREVAHRITEERPFRGTRCEFIQVNVESGNYVHYTFDTGRARPGPGPRRGCREAGAGGPAHPRRPAVPGPRGPAPRAAPGAHRGVADRDAPGRHLRPGRSLAAPGPVATDQAAPRSAATAARPA